MDWAAIISAAIALIGTIIVAIFTYFNKKEVARLEASLKKKERLEASRSSGYEKIWTLTGTLNLFGPTTDPDIKDFSTQLKDWYFKHGLTLSGESKTLYFLVQEILNFAMLHSAIFRRPPGDKLYGDQNRPIKVLDNLRSEYLGVTGHGGEAETLEPSVSAWKEKCKKQEVQAEENWVLLQFVLSRFRSGLIKDLGLNEERKEK